MQYIYTDDYTLPGSNSEAASGTEAPVSPEEDENDMHQLAAHVYVHAAADLYDIPPLEALAATKFIAAAKPVKEKDRVEFLELVARVARHTMPSEQNVLRTKVLQMALQQKKLLLQDRTFVELLFERNDLDDFVPRFICGTVAGYEEAAIRTRAKYKTSMDNRKVELERAQTASEEAVHAKEIAVAEVATLRKDRDNTRQQLGDKQRELETIRTDRDDIRQQLNNRQRELENIRTAREQSNISRDNALAEVTTLRADRDETRRQLNNSNSQLRDVRNHLSAANTRARNAQDILDRRVQSFARIRHCRHCGDSPFEYTIDEEHNARCNECDTRHHGQCYYN